MLASVNPRVKSFLISDAFYYAGYDVVGAFLAILITNQVSNGSPEMVGFVMAYGMMLRPFIELPISKISKRLSIRTRINLVGVGTIVTGILMVIMGQATQIWHVFAIQTIMSMSDAVTFPIKWGIFTKILDKRNIEFEWTLEDLVTIIPSSLSATMAGIISVTWGLPSLFIFFGTLYVFSGLTFLLIDKHGHAVQAIHPKLSP